MRFASTIGAALAVVTAFAPAGAMATDKSPGQQEFESRCASCHGLRAKGDGWMVKYLSHRPQSLTQLRKKNGGVFPYAYVYQAIDGRRQVQLHGPRDMPVWGTVIPTEIERKSFGTVTADEKAVWQRIHAMIEYLATLQE